MRPPDPPPPVTDQAYLDHLGQLVVAGGASHWGVAPATVLDRARQALIHRKRAGLHDTMQFTYRNPLRSTDPQAAVRGARAVLVAALPYDAPTPPEPGDADGRPLLTGHAARYVWSDHYGTLRDALGTVAKRLRADGFKAVVFADDNSLVDRELAYLAGLGWFGKNANLLVPGAGSWFVLGSVVTTAALPVAGAPVADGCGTCSRCITACPTAAIVAPGVIDARRCLSWLLQRPGTMPVEFRVAVGRRIYGCDDCQEACPPTVVLGRRHRPRHTTTTTTTVHTSGTSAIDLLGLLDADDAGVLASWGSWYLADRQPRWVRRNALVAVGNALAEADLDPALRGRALATLSRYVGGIDELLAEHAGWALRRAALGVRP